MIFTWFPAITTTGLLAAVLWLARKLIATRLTKSVKHEFDRKIESLRADLRQKEAEITALRSGALSALASRQAALEQRKLEAVDQLWSSVNALARGRSLVASVSLFKFESAADLAEKDPKFRQLFEVLSGGFDLLSVDRSGAAKARQYVSPTVCLTDGLGDLFRHSRSGFTHGHEVADPQKRSGT